MADVGDLGDLVENGRNGYLVPSRDPGCYADRLIEIISLKSRLRPGPLDHETRRRFYTALYDLDAFRDRLFNNRRLESLDIDPQKLTAAETDDTALLEVGLEYVKKVLFQT